MTLSAVKGARRPSPSITWVDASGTVDLSGCALTGTIKNAVNKEERAITGTLVVTDAPGGVFVWNYSADDVATAGTYLVQFNAAFVSGPTPAKTMNKVWEVL